MTEKEGVSESRFYMWRGVVVMIHADNMVTPQELSFINDYIKDMNLSQEQLDIIHDDLKNPQDTFEIFTKITDEEDKKDFFALARAVAWCDGNFVKQEERIIKLFEEQKLSDENLSYLEGSRDMMNEIELNQNQWEFQADEKRSIFDFLKMRKSKPA